MAAKKGSKRLGIDNYFKLMNDGDRALAKFGKIGSNSGPFTTERKMVNKVQQGNKTGGGYSGGYRAAKGSEFGMLSAPKATKSVPFSSKPKAKVVKKK